MAEWLERQVVPVRKCGIEEVQAAKCPYCQRWHTTPYMYYFTEYSFCPNCGKKIGEIEFVRPSLFDDGKETQNDDLRSGKMQRTN